MTGPRAAALATLQAYAPSSAEQRALRARFAQHLADHRDGLLRTCRPDHVTASVLVLSADAEHVLLTLHAKARRWFQLGGHVEPEDLSLVAAADRELAEESGLPDLRVDPLPVHLDAHRVDFCGPEPAWHLDVRFVAVAAPGAEAPGSAESLALAWWPAAAMPSDEASLVDLVAAGRRRVRENAPSG